MSLKNLRDAVSQILSVSGLTVSENTVRHGGTETESSFRVAQGGTPPAYFSDDYWLFEVKIAKDPDADGGLLAHVAHHGHRTWRFRFPDSADERHLSASSFLNQVRQVTVANAYPMLADLKRVSRETAEILAESGHTVSEQWTRSDDLRPDGVMLLDGPDGRILEARMGIEKDGRIRMRAIEFDADTKTLEANFYAGETSKDTIPVFLDRIRSAVAKAPEPAASPAP